MQHVFSFWQKCHETTIVYSLQQSLTTLQTQFAGIEQVHNVYNWNYGPDSGLIHYWVYVCQSTSIFITFFRGLTGLTILPFGLPIQPSPERERETDLKLLGSVPPEHLFDVTSQYGSLLLFLYLQQVPQLWCNALNLRMSWGRPWGHDSLARQVAAGLAIIGELLRISRWVNQKSLKACKSNYDHQWLAGKQI